MRVGDSDQRRERLGARKRGSRGTASRSSITARVCAFHDGVLRLASTS